MRLEIFVIAVTAFLVYNTYRDGQYTKMLMSLKKYYKMIFYVIMGIGVYSMLKSNPSRASQLLYYANGVVQGMPIDRSSFDMLSPILDVTGVSGGGNTYMESINRIPPRMAESDLKARFRGGLGGVHEVGSGRTTKRSVSETKKKYVASSQNWLCAGCSQQLDHTFEVDHRVRLEYGGSNDATNLVALCRNCHGRKTASENMG